MEHLTLEEQPQSGQQRRSPQPILPGQIPPTSQLPPQMFTTAAQLLDLTDKKLMVVLRDGRKFVGVLRSWDQFANLVLQDTVERIFSQQFYADIRSGVQIIRGENVTLLGELDLDQDDNIPEPYREASVDKVRELQKQEAERKRKKDKSRLKLLYQRGFEGDVPGESILM